MLSVGNELRLQWHHSLTLALSEWGRYMWTDLLEILDENQWIAGWRKMSAYTINRCLKWIFPWNSLINSTENNERLCVLSFLSVWRHTWQNVNIRTLHDDAILISSSSVKRYIYFQTVILLRFSDSSYECSTCDYKISTMILWLKYWRNRMHQWIHFSSATWPSKKKTLHR